jgi:hypothetical protein
MRFTKRIFLLLFLLCLCAPLPVIAASAEPPAAALPGWQAGTFWADIKGLDADEPMRLWLSFIRTDSASADAELGALMPDEVALADVRLGMLGVYSRQMQMLGASNVLPADELKLYLVDKDFDNALPLDPAEPTDEHPRTLGEIWRLAQGEGSVSALDRTFADKANPMGILRSSLAAYLKRTSSVGTTNLSESEIEETSKAQFASQSASKQTGIILLLAPEGAVSPPQEVEFRYPVSQNEASLSQTRPKNHTQEKHSAIATASETITQVRVKSGVFLDVRLYNNDKQVNFKQKTGKCDSGVCLDLIIYGKPKDFPNLTLGMTGAADARLRELGVDVIHVRIAGSDAAGAYKEYWRELPVP